MDEHQQRDHDADTLSDEAYWSKYGHGNDPEPIRDDPYTRGLTGEPTPERQPIAACGRLDAHGGHATPHRRPAWCAGNRDILTAPPEPLQIGTDVVPFGPGAIRPLGGDWLPGDVAVSIEAHEDHDTVAVLTLILSEGDAGTVRLLAELTREDCLALADKLAEIADPDAGPPSVSIELSADQGNCPNGHACELRVISVNHRDEPVVPYSRSCGVEDCGYRGPALWDRVTRQNASAPEHIFPAAR